MKKEYCTPEIIIRKYDLCEEVSESGGENPDQKKEPENPSEEQAPENPDSPKEPEDPSGEKIPDTPDQEKETGDIDNESKKGNKYYTILQCAVMLDKYYESARKLDNGNNNSMTFQSEDLKKWQDFYYPTLVESKIIQNGDYFDATNPDSYGIKKDGTFTKLGFCHFAYRCYKTIMDNTQVVETYTPLYDFCCSLDEDVEHFRGNAYNCSEQRYIKKKDLWHQEYYETYSKTGIIEDADFFNGGDPNPNYGIGADALYDKQELIHFLYRAYRYIYSFCAYHNDMIFCGINLNEDMVSRYYAAEEDGIIESICFLDPICSEVIYKDEVNGFTNEYVFWHNKNGSFVGVGEMSQANFEITLKENKLTGITFHGKESKKTQNLIRKGRLLDYWVGVYSLGNNSLRVKDYNTITWNGKSIQFEYDEASNSFEQLVEHENIMQLSGNFHIVDGKKQLTLFTENKKLAEEFIVDSHDEKVNLPPNTSIPQYKYDSELYMCVICNLFYHSINCYTIKDGKPESAQFLVTIPAQGVANLFLPLDMDICFTTNNYITNTYRITKDENYVLLGVGEDFGSGCSTQLDGFSYFSYKTKFDSIDEKENKQSRLFTLKAEENAAFLMVKLEKYIVSDSHNADVYIKMPNADPILISNISEFIAYEGNSGGILIIENPTAGVWEITIPNDDKIEISVSGHVMPFIKGAKAQDRYELAIRALKLKYDYPEQKYAEMFFPICLAIQESRSKTTVESMLCCSFLSWMRIPAQGTKIFINSSILSIVGSISFIAANVGLMIKSDSLRKKHDLSADINISPLHTFETMLDDIPADGHLNWRKVNYKATFHKKINENEEITFEEAYINYFKIRHFHSIIKPCNQKSKIKILCCCSNCMSDNYKAIKVFFDMLSLVYLDKKKEEDKKEEDKKEEKIGKAPAFDIYFVDINNNNVNIMQFYESNPNRRQYSDISSIYNNISNDIDCYITFSKGKDGGRTNSAVPHFDITFPHIMKEVEVFINQNWEYISTNSSYNYFNPTDEDFNNICKDMSKYNKICNDFKTIIDSIKIDNSLFTLLTHEFLHIISYSLNKITIGYSSQILDKNLEVHETIFNPDGRGDEHVVYAYNLLFYPILPKYATEIVRINNSINRNPYNFDDKYYKNLITRAYIALWNNMGKQIKYKAKK